MWRLWCRTRRFKVWEDAARITPDGRTGFLLRWAITVARNEARNQRQTHRAPRAT